MIAKSAPQGNGSQVVSFLIKIKSENSQYLKLIEIGCLLKTKTDIQINLQKCFLPSKSSTKTIKSSFNFGSNIVPGKFNNFCLYKSVKFVHFIFVCELNKALFSCLP